MSLVEQPLDRNTLPDVLKAAFTAWNVEDETASLDASPQLSLVLQFCQEQDIPLTFVVSKKSVNRSKERGMHPRTAGRNAQRLPGREYVFNTAGDIPVSLSVEGLGCLVIRNRREKRIGIFVPQDTVDLYPTPSEQTSAAS
jgi:hypothetical protein